jgi:hypothetical protein
MGMLEGGQYTNVRSLCTRASGGSCRTILAKSLQCNRFHPEPQEGSMAWFNRNRYDTGYRAADRNDWTTGYGRIDWDREREWSGGPSHRYWDTRDYGADYTDRGWTGASWGGYAGGGAYGRGVRAGYGREYREPVAPRQSPAYGRGGDRAAREWARQHGYDASMTIQPRQSGGMGVGGMRRGWSAGGRSGRSNADYWADYGRRRARFDRW